MESPESAAPPFTWTGYGGARIFSQQSSHQGKSVARVPSSTGSVKDHIISVGGLKHVVVGNELIASCSSARRKYMDDLDRKREQERKTRLQRKRQVVVDDMDVLKKRFKDVTDDVVHLRESADKLYQKAEQTRKISFVSSGNAMKKSIVEKEQELQDLKEQLNEKEKLLLNV